MWSPEGRALRWYLVLSVAGIGCYPLLPHMAQNLAFLASNVVAAAVMLRTVRRRRRAPRGAWLLVCAFPAATGVGNLVYFIDDSLLHVDPFPSPGDAAFFAGYLLLAAGLLRLQQRRSAGLDLDALLDTAVVTVGFAAASWMVFMSPLLHDDASPLLQRLTALGYPVVDVVVLCVTARFLFTERRSSPVFGWLVGLVALMVTADTAFGVLNMTGSYITGHPIDVLMLGYNLGWAALVLHPRADELSVPARVAADHHPGWARLVALTAASLAAPTVLVAQVATGHLRDIAITAVASALVFALVVLRMGRLVVRLEAVVEQRRALQAELEHRAHHDDLTGLANRRWFGRCLADALEKSPGGGTAVLFCDLDRFKAVNDSLGHAAGDALLAATAQRLLATLEPGDMAARLGGDEFAVLLAQPLDESGLAGRAARVTAALGVPVSLNGLDTWVSVSVGSAVARAGDREEDVLIAADCAMYAVKPPAALSSDRRPPAPSSTSAAGAGRRTP